MKPRTLWVLAVGIILTFSSSSVSVRAQPIASDLDVDVHRWTNVGPGDSRVICIAVDPGNSNVIYANVEGSGVHKSTDGGLTWNLAHTGLPAGTSTPVSWILVDRTSGGIVYAATSWNGIFKSTDGGAHWIPSSQGLTSWASNVRMLVAHPSNPGVLYAATSDGVFRTNNAGASWQKANSGVEGTLPSAQVLAIAPGAGTLYAGFRSAVSRLYKSTDGAQSWQPVGGGLPDVDVSSLAIDPEDPETVYLGTDGQGIYKTANGGAAWQPCPANPEMAGFRVDYLSIDPLNTGTIYAGTSSRTYKSLNAGANWMRIREGSVVSALAADPNRRGTVYSGDGDGLWKTAGPAVTFSPPKDISQHPDWVSTMAASAMDAAGKTHVAFVGWFPEEGAPDGVASEVFYTNNVGGPFSPPVRLPTAPVPPDAHFTHNPHYSKVPVIALDGQGHAHIAYYRTEGQLSGSGLLCYTENASGSFSIPLTAFRKPDHTIVESASHISIAIDGLGRVHLAANLGAIAYYAKGAAGVFPDLQPLAAPGYEQAGSPCLRSDPGGSIHMLFWGKNPSGNQDLLYTNNVGGGSFSPPVLVYGSTLFFALDADLAVDSQGVAHVVFRGETGGVRYLNNSAGPFGTPVTASGWGFMQDLEVGVQGGRFLAYKYPGTYQAMGFTVFEGDDFVDLTPPWEIYGMTSSQWDGGWFQADEDRHLFHFVYTVFDIWYVQARMCDCSISERKTAYGRQGGSGSLSITASGICPWQAKSTVDWITITSTPAGNGNGTIQYTVAPNESGLERVGKLIAGGQTLVVSQSYRYLTLNEGRFKVEVQWKEPGTGITHSGVPVNLTNDCGYFWFFGPDNLELLVKILDGRSVNGHYWVFYGALTDVEYDLIITDSTTGHIKTYHSSLGVQAGRNDITAFADSASQGSVGLATEVTGSSPQSGQLLLNRNRFRVEVGWQTPTGSGQGVAVPLTGDSGYFWFFGETNVELLVKILDGTAVNGRFWVFFGALTDVRYTITVTDTFTGGVKTYEGQQGVQQSGNDTTAFPGS